MGKTGKLLFILQNPTHSSPPLYFPASSGVPSSLLVFHLSGFILTWLHSHLCAYLVKLEDTVLVFSFLHLATFPGSPPAALASSVVFKHPELVLPQDLCLAPLSSMERVKWSSEPLHGGPPPQFCAQSSVPRTGLSLTTHLE